MAQSTEQLISTAELFIKLGKPNQAKKIVKRLLDSHRTRLKEIATIDIGEHNKSDIMRELNEIQFLTSGAINDPS